MYNTKLFFNIKILKYETYTRDIFFRATKYRG